jgi:hypothetical protein
MNSIQKRRILVIALVVTGMVCACAYLWFKFFRYQKEGVPPAIDLMQIAENRLQQSFGTEESATGEVSQILPKELNFEMTFYAQAPFGNWDYPWQESCEEASILLIVNEYQDKNWTREEFNQQILDLVEYEKKVYGQYEHQTAQDIKEILKNRYGLESVIINNPSFEDVQKTLNKGHLIIMTFAGKKIGNPNYKNGGPIYHAMVIKGYKEGNKIITEDVGTRNGADYVYPWTTLYNALHDWSTPIENGPKRMIEVIPPVNNSPA